MVRQTEKCARCNNWMEYIHEEVGWIHLCGKIEATCGNQTYDEWMQILEGN